MSSTDPPEVALGRRIRALRKSARATLKQVAEAADISESFLSQVERGVTSPSMTSLTRIAQAIGADVASLFVGDEPNATLVRAGQGRHFSHPSGSHEEHMLTSASAKRLAVVRAFIDPGEDSGAEMYSHAADEEVVVVLSGSLTVWVESTRHVLEPGDALTLDPRRPHRYKNERDVRVDSIWTMTPPVY